MKVNVIPMGGGLNRLVVEPQCSCELSTPSHVVDRMVADVIHREKFIQPRPWIMRGPRPNILPHTACAPTVKRQIERSWRDTPNEPHGIDIHVDRPLRENFWSHRDWAEAMAKYRTLEDVAADCDWPCKEPMKGTVVERWGRPCCATPIRRTIPCVTAEPNFPIIGDTDWMFDDMNYWG